MGIIKVIKEIIYKWKTAKLRNKFASLALQAIISNEVLRQEVADKCADAVGEENDKFVIDTYCQMAYMLADGMLKIGANNV